MMTNKMLAFSILLIASTTEGKAANLTAPPEVPTAIELSNRDINRIVCPGKINDLIFSDTNAFIKVKIEQLGDDRIYADVPSELFVVCDNTVYTLIATPKDIPSVTLRLKQGQQPRLLILPTVCSQEPLP